VSLSEACGADVRRSEFAKGIRNVVKERGKSAEFEQFVNWLDRNPREVRVRVCAYVFACVLICLHEFRMCVTGFSFSSFSVACAFKRFLICDIHELVSGVYRCVLWLLSRRMPGHVCSTIRLFSPDCGRSDMSLRCR
jgi:hypothetical protein